MHTERFHYHSDDSYLGPKRVITDVKTGYTLPALLERRWLLLSHQVEYKGRVGKSVEPTPITTRDVFMYTSIYEELANVDPGTRCLEVGPGLGGFLERLAKQSSRLPRDKPVAIDPADYESLEALTRHALASATELELPDPARERLEVLIRRCELIQDATKVQLLNMTFLKAFRLYPELRGSFDMVVDLAGATLYPQAEIGRKLKNANRWKEFLRRQYTQLLRSPENGMVLDMH